MVEKMKVISAMRPRIELGKMAGTDDLVNYISSRTNLNRGAILHTLCEFHAAIIHFARMAIPVKLEGIGVFSPSIRKDGKIGLSIRRDRRLIKALGTNDTYEKTILNPRSIGKSIDQLVEMWNARHPENPVAE